MGYVVTESIGHGVDTVVFTVSLVSGTIGDQPPGVPFGAGRGVTFGSGVGVRGSGVGEETGDVGGGEVGVISGVFVLAGVFTGVGEGDRDGDSVGEGDGVRAPVVRVVVWVGVGVREAEGGADTVGVGFGVPGTVVPTVGASVLFTVGTVVWLVVSVVEGTVVAPPETVGPTEVAFAIGDISVTGVAVCCVDAGGEGAGVDAWTAQRHPPKRRRRSRRAALMRGLKVDLRNMDGTDHRNRQRPGVSAGGSMNHPINDLAKRRCIQACRTGPENPL